MVNEYSSFPVFLSTYFFPSISTDSHTHAKVHKLRRKNKKNPKK